MGTIVTGAMTAVGQFAAGNAKANAANYNAQVAIMNANQQKQNAVIASQSGSQQATMQSLKTRATIGAERANQGASGVNVNTGSAIDTQASTHEIGTLDAMTVRTNAAREAFGYQTAAVNQEAQATLDKYEAKYDREAGMLQAGTTLLSTGQDAAAKFAKLQMAGGL